VQREYVVRAGPYAGTRLEIGRVDRRIVDNFVAENQEPEPPERKASEMGIEIWGEPDQLLKDYKDADYQAARAEWNLKFGLEMFTLLAEAVRVPEQAAREAEIEARDLAALGIAADAGKPSLLANVLASSADDLSEIVEIILYNSTVTIRGLVEAAQAYNVRWRGKKVPVVEPPSGPLKCNGVLGDRLAAQWAGYTHWDEFCELPGPEQSAIVALFRYKGKIEELFTKHYSKK
jgi:hypothetical protein